VTGSIDIGGLVGYDNSSTVTNSFWDMQTSGWSTSGGGTGKTTAEMKTLSTFTNAGWDFIGETTNGADDHWGIIHNHSYPFLSWQNGVSVDFYAVPTEVFVGAEIQFTDTSFGVSSQWRWDFDNDSIYDSTEQNPVYSYNASGTYTVKLTVSNGGNSDSIIKTDYINVISSISAPENVQVGISNGDAVISWDEVTEDGEGNTIIPDGYVVKYSENGNNYFFLSFVSNGTSFTQLGVALYSSNMFYEVVTVVNSSTHELEYLQQINNSNQEVKWEDVKTELERISRGSNSNGNNDRTRWSKSIAEF